MITLTDFLKQIPNTNYENVVDYYLVFNEELNNNLVAANSLQPTNIQVETLLLTDNRYAIPADLLSEINEGQLYEAGFKGLNQNNFSQVEVITSEQLEVLLPLSEEVI